MANVYQLDRTQTFTSGDVTVITEGDATTTFDPGTSTTQIAMPDGTVEVSLGVKPLQRQSKDFDDNLAEQLTDAELSAISEKLLQGIESDIQSRSEWLENMRNAISLLGLQIKMPRGAAASGSTPAEGVSTVDHPLLLEAVLDFQANALGELLPTDGPVKVRNDGLGNALSDELAQALEKDMNHYLTKVAKEYYPDTDRMLLMLGFCGIAFKKGYHDPIKQRPVIASIDAQNLIVSNTATNLEGAARVTHRIMMPPATLRRMQLVGAYRDISLPDMSMQGLKNPVDAKIDEIQGIAPPSYVEPSEQDRELYECYCEIEVPGFEHTLNGEQTGLPLPYKVTLDKDARRILEIRRNWEEEDQFCLPINRIIAYTFIPGIGFYGIGLLNVLGNATKAVTAAWRLLIDSGMYSNFPGFLYLKSLAKQLTNQFRIPPGGGMPIDTMGTDIRAAVMALPYQPPNPVFIQLIENIVQTAQRVGGSAQKIIGEGKQDAPVGTTLALIEQAVKLMSAVHKRLHVAQGHEFEMLKGLLMEDPEALWRHNKKSHVLACLTKVYGQQPVVDAQAQAEQEHRARFLSALGEAELIPRADPNTSSQTERYLKVTAMRQMAMTNQGLDLNAIDRRAFQVMGVDDADSLFKPPPPPGAAPPPPENVTAQATMLAAQAKLTDSATKARDSQLKAQQDLRDQQQQNAMRQQELASKEQIAKLGVARELVIHNADVEAQQRAVGVENQQRSLDRMHEAALSSIANRAKSRESGLDRAHGLMSDALDRQHEAAMTGASQGHEASQSALDRMHDLAMNPVGNGIAPQ